MRMNITVTKKTTAMMAIIMYEPQHSTSELLFFFPIRFRCVVTFSTLVSATSGVAEWVVGVGGGESASW